MSNTINNNIPFVPENTIDPAAGLNLSLNTIDAILQCAVLTVGNNTPAVAPVDGDRHIVGTSPVGAWAGHANKLARYLDGGWQFFDARIAYNTADSSIYCFDGVSWIQQSGATPAIDNVTRPAIAFIGDSRTDGFVNRYTFDYGYADETSEIIPGDLNLKLTQIDGELFAQIQEASTSSEPPDYGAMVKITGPGYFVLRAENTDAWLTMYLAHSTYDFVMSSTTADPLVLPRIVVDNATIGATGKRHNHWAEYFLSTAYDVVTTQCISGDKLTGMQHRISSLYSVDEYGFPLTRTPDIVVLFGGTNDNSDWFSDQAPVKAAIDNIVWLVTSRGSRLVICTIFTENPSAQDFQSWQEMNEYFRLKELENGRVSVCDYASLLLDNNAIDGAPIPDTIIGLHEINSGAQLEGKLLADHISAIVPATKRSGTTYGGDYTNELANGTMTGVGGTAGAGTSGDVADSWTLACTTGSATVAGSIIAPVTGTKWQRMAATFTAADEEIDFSADVATLTAGGFLYAGFEVSGEFNSVVKEARAFIDVNDGGDNRYSVSSFDGDSDNVAFIQDNMVFFPVAKRIQITGDTTAVTVSLKLISASAGSVTVDVRNAYAKYE